MDGKIPTVFAAIMIVAAAATGVAVGYLAFHDDSSPVNGDIVDAAGRMIEAPDDLDDGIVTIGVGALRFISYFNLNDKVVMVDLGDVNAGGYNAKGYGYAYDYYLENLNGTITSHSHNSVQAADVEAIGDLGPSLIVVSKSVYDSYKTNCNTLANVYSMVVIDELESFIDVANYKITTQFAQQLDLLGKVLKMEKRANDLKSGINDVLNDINIIVGESTSSKKVYIAGAAASGAKALNWTMGNYWALDLINGTNAYTASSFTMSVEVNVEAVAALGAEIILIDPTTKNTLSQTGSQGVLEAYADKDVRAYVILPYVWYGINFENVLANAYLLANMIYGDDMISSSVVTQKINKVYELFYGDDGSDIYANMTLYFENVFKPNGADVVKAAGDPLSIGSEYQIDGSAGNRTLVKVVA